VKAKIYILCVEKKNSEKSVRVLVSKWLNPKKEQLPKKAQYIY
jgi:hypothetical protein